MLASKDYLEQLIELCPDGIIGVNRQGTIVIFNQAAEQLTGFPASEVLDVMPITEIYRPSELARMVKKELYCDDNGGCGRLKELEVEVRGAGGSQVPIRLSASLIHKDGQEVGSVGFFHDMSTRKEMEEELRRRSITDSLTGLYNRRHFHTRISEEVERSHRYGAPLALAILDLDNFKPFNDNYGHQEGDAILQFISELMVKSTRNMDQVFRLGGDEFALVLVETDLVHGALAMERLRNSTNDLWPTRMAYLGNAHKKVTISLGLAQLQEGERPDKFIKRADLAMYEAKHRGGDSIYKAE